ncbi:hypothetical protein WME79_31525 [Sorangium sp. So ce726]|uniref:hypothetical protein n=1 Tax=Sorangium sp. So ce726 TaxID=3133319 RepID=UPI003F61E635
MRTLLESSDHARGRVERHMSRRALSGAAALLLIGAAACGSAPDGPGGATGGASTGASSAGAGGGGGPTVGSGGSGGAEPSGGGQGGASEGRDCGTAGEVIVVGANVHQETTGPAPELERLRGCTRFLGTLHLLGLDGPEAIDALTDLKEIAGSLLLHSPPEELGPLSNLTRIEGRLLVVSAPEALRGLESIQYVSGLWLYQSGFADFSWLPALTEIGASMIARRNANLTAEALESFATSHVRSGALVSLTNAVPKEPPDPDAEAVVCGQPDDLVLGPYTSVAGCTRFRGSIHLSDTMPGALEPLSSLVHIDGSLTLFRNHTDDFTALRNLRRVGANFQMHLLEGPGLDGFDALAEVGEINLVSAGELTGFDWLPALTSVRESAFAVRGPPLSTEALESFLSRLDIGGETAVMTNE